MKNIDLNRVDRALIIKLRHIGDVLITAPVFAALKDARPGVRLTALVPKGTEDMLSLNPDVDEIIALDKDAGLSGNLGLIKKLRSARYDLAINMTEGDRGAILAVLSGARYRIGVYPYGRGFWGKERLFTSLVKPVYDGRHRAMVDLDMLAPLGIKVDEPRFRIYTSEEDDGYVKKLLADNGIEPGARYAVVHPTSRWMFKCWREEAVADVIDYIEGRGVRVAVTSGPDAKETDMVARILRMAKSSPLDLSGKLSLKRLASLMKGSAMYFGVDTAPMHMAAAAGVPVVALFGPSDSSIWGPLSPLGRVVDKRNEFSCIPCKKDGCEGTKKSKCLDAITVDDAIAAVDEFIGAAAK